MLKVVSMSTTGLLGSNSEDVIIAESHRETLWMISWIVIKDCSYTQVFSPELALQFVKSLSAYHGTCSDEFRYSDNVKVFLNMLVMLARPKAHSYSEEPAGDAPAERPSTSSRSKSVEIQLQRSILESLRRIHPTDYFSLSSLADSLADLCFGNQHVAIVDDVSNVVFLPCSEKLRGEAGEILCTLIGSSNFDHHSSQSNNAGSGPSKKGSANVNDRIIAKFVDLICSRAIDERAGDVSRVKRLNSIDAGSNTNSTNHEASVTSNFSSMFLSSISKLMAPTPHATLEVGNELENDTVLRRRNCVMIASVRPVIFKSKVEAGNNVWIPLLFVAEIKVMHTLLIKAFTQKEAVHCDLVKAVQFVACALSPWSNASEISPCVDDNVDSLNSCLDMVINIVKLVFDRIVDRTFVYLHL
jgi:hypothetical protein